MTQVSSAKSPKDNTILAVGQAWLGNSNGEYCYINKLEMLPYLNAFGNNTQVTFTDEAGKVQTASFLDFVIYYQTLAQDVDYSLLGGLHDYHLLGIEQTIAVGQRWMHHKGEIYVITGVAIDANVGVDDFGKAIISYRTLQTGKTHTWALTVNEFLAITKEGKKRFKLVPVTGKEKRNVMKDQSLRHLWRISA